MRGTDPQKYLLKVTAGPSYENQEDVLVNTNTPAKISSEHIDAHVHVRVKDFRGMEVLNPLFARLPLYHNCREFQNPLPHNLFKLHPTPYPR